MNVHFKIVQLYLEHFLYKNKNTANIFSFKSHMLYKIRDYILRSINFFLTLCFNYFLFRIICRKNSVVKKKL